MIQRYVSEERFLELLERVSKLESKVKELEESYIKNNKVIKRNRVGEYNLKIVYPGIFKHIDTPSAGFPKNKKPLAEQMTLGTKVFIYVTSPYKKIIGLAEPIQNMIETDNERWPYNVPLKWVIGPCVPGVRIKDVDLDIRPRPGDTNFELTEEEAKRIIDILKRQKPLNDDNIDDLLK